MHSSLPRQTGIRVKKGFWARQFGAHATDSQKIFDWILGVALPVVCFVADPIVFKRSWLREPILGNYRPFAYLLSFVSIMAMSAWLIRGAKLKRLNSMLAGLFIAGGVISLMIGVVLFPFSVAGLFFLIGVLGFVPLFSALVYLRNGIRALRMAKPYVAEKVLARAFLLSVIFSAVVPYAINQQIRTTVDAITRSDAQTIRANGRTLKLIAPLVSFDSLAQRYHLASTSERESEEMKALADVYFDLTGLDIETQAQILFD